MQKTLCKGKVQIQFKSETSDDSLIIKGYASTSDVDRVGEYFVPGAWKAAIAGYMSTNPVLLLDHNQHTSSVIGKVVKLEETSKGLYFEAKLTNDPAFDSLRYRVKEGLINSVSVSGRWSYDGPAIKLVTDLYEISLVAVPCNPNALVSAKQFESDNIEVEKPNTIQFVR